MCPQLRPRPGQRSELAAFPPCVSCAPVPDRQGRIDCDEFIALGKKVDVFAGAAEAFMTKDEGVKKARRRAYHVDVNKGSQLGPVLSIVPHRLSLEAQVGELVERTVEMRNMGSTAIYYEWERVALSTGLGSTAVVEAVTQVSIDAPLLCESTHHGMHPKCPLVRSPRALLRSILRRRPRDALCPPRPTRCASPSAP